MANLKDPAVTVWYDGQCPLCLREIALMRKLDRAGRIAFVDATETGAQCPLDPRILLARFHAREADGPIVSGAAAFAAMWRAIPLLAPFGALARIKPILWLLERAYLIFLRFRPRLQAMAKRKPQRAG